MSKEKLLVIDGNSLAHRAFHAIPLLSTSQGIITNAVFGFTNMLLKILAEQQPDLVAVCFDKSKITFRHNEYGEYKAHRRATPDELRPQFPLLKEMLQAMRITVLEFEGYEADDLIGTLVTRAEESGLNNYILTGDQDALQLVSPKTTVLLTRKGITEIEEYNQEKVVKRFGITSSQFPDFKGLVGDQSDNIPGIPGVGPKTAVDLLKKYGHLEEIITRIDQLPDRLQEKIRPFASQAVLSKHLATIIRNVPVRIELEKCRWPGPDYSELLAFFSKVEFKSLIRAITKQDAKVEIDTCEVNYQRITRPEELDNFLMTLPSNSQISLALEGSRETGPKAAALALEKESSEFQVVYLPLTGQERQRRELIDILRKIFLRCKIITHDAKNVLWLLGCEQINSLELAFDTMVAAYLVNPGLAGYELPDLALEHLNIVLPRQDEKALAAQAEAIFRLAGVLAEKIRLQEGEKLFYEVEMPLVSVLADMEMAGVTVDKQQLAEMSKELGQRLEELSEEIYSLAGERFNINSTRQLGQILFEKLQLPVIKKTKTGYSTDAQALEELSGTHPIVAKILEHRQIVKLKSTYVDGLAALINPHTGRVHTTFHQTVTATGRLSSANPNLQNIPIRMEEGRKIRKVFIPRQKDNVILTADYSQIELRILAHMTGDPSLTSAFQNGEDVHTRTASEVFGVAVEAVTKDMRNHAKAVNFGIIYGMSDFGLARDINIPREEAKRYIQTYFTRYAGVKKYIESTIQQAREKGYVTTLLNRRRYLPDLFSPNRNIRNFGERTAMNTPIQGSAADIIKLAMIRIHRELRRRQLNTRMILQVHDELIFDVPLAELEEVKELVKEHMENALTLNVPLVVEMKAGPNWYEVVKIDS